MPSFISIHPTVWSQYTNVTDRTGQRSDSIGRTVLQTVAQKMIVCEVHYGRGHYIFALWLLSLFLSEMTYNVFSGTLNPTHCTPLYLSFYISIFFAGLISPVTHSDWMSTIWKF